MRRSRLVFGTADLRDDDVTPKLLDQFYEAGGRSLDVANVYGDGESEQAVGKWLAARGVRDDIVLYGKGCHPPFCHPKLVCDEVDQALALLGVDVLDVFMLHRDDVELPVGSFGEALLDQVAASKIQGFGVSNWTLPRFFALAESLHDDRRHLVAFSNHFSLGDMVTPTWPGCLAMTKVELIDLEHAGVEALAWASLASGYFAGRKVQSWSTPDNAKRRQRATELARRLGVTPAAVALAYVLHQPQHVLAAFGTRSESHLTEALTSLEIELSSTDLAWLERGDAETELS